MADNTKIGPIFRGANGGLSDDLFTGIRNSFYYSNNMEIREDAKSIYPKQEPTSNVKDLGTRTSVGNVKAVLNFNNAWYIFAEKAIFKRSGDTVTTLATWMTSIKDAELFNGYVYISTTAHLYRIGQTNSDASWGSSAGFVDISLNSSANHPLYATDILLAVGNGTEVSKVTKEIPDQIQSGIELQSDYSVKFINELGGFLRITAEDSNYGAEVLLWDKISNQANEIIPMNGYKFLQSCIYNGYHYLLSNKGLGLMNGYQYYILKRIEDLSTSDRISNGMLVYDDKLYFVTVEGIFIYGAKNKNYTDVLNMWRARTDTTGKPGALGTDGLNLVYTEAHTNTSDDNVHTYTYEYSSGEEKGYEGELQTMAYFGTALSEIKQSMYLRIGYNIPQGFIKVYYRTEADVQNHKDPSERGWHEITPMGGLTKDSDMRSPFATTLKLNCRFQWIQFKFVIRQSTVLTRPYTQLYSADLYYNVMLD